MDAWFHRSKAISFEVVISSLLFKPDYTDRFHGNTQSPQHFSNPSKFFSASLMSWLIWSIPSSIRSSCSESYSVYKLTRPLIHFFFFSNFYIVLFHKWLRMYRKICSNLNKCTECQPKHIHVFKPQNVQLH